jgi:hypothetical protein
MSSIDYAQSFDALAEAGPRRIANLQAQLAVATTPDLRDLLNRAILVTAYCVAQSRAAVKDAGDLTVAEIQGRAAQVQREIDALRATASTAATSERTAIYAEVARKSREMVKLTDRVEAARAKRGAEYDVIERSLAAQTAILTEIIWVRSSTEQFRADLSPILSGGLIIEFPGLSQMMTALELYKKGRTLGLDETIGASDYPDAVERYRKACADWFAAFSNEYQPRINAFVESKRANQAH